MTAQREENGPTAASRGPVKPLVLAAALLALTGTWSSAEPAPDHRLTGWQPLVLAAYQAWHGLPSHSEAFSGAFWLDEQRPYDSRRRAVLSRHVTRAKAMGIDGFVVDWYGQPGDFSNSEDRAHIDRATEKLLQEAEAQGFWIALMYDEGTVPQPGLPTADYESRVVSDLRYAERYFSSPAYLRLEGSPALFVFPYGDVDPHLDWPRVRAALSGPVTLLDKDPDDPDDVAVFDGFYAWVHPGNQGWDPDGGRWGKPYLKWFYRTTRSAAYAGKIAVGGVWPGFDDSLVPPPWGQMRFMRRRDGRVYAKTWKLARRSEPPIVLICTWNDFEEGTDIEFGVRMIVDMEPSLPEILIRSSPLEVVWDEARGQGDLQFYRGGEVIYDERHGSGGHFALASGVAYEIKLWIGGPPMSRTVKIRRQDRIPGATPIMVD